MSRTNGDAGGGLRRAPVQRRSTERLARILDACARELDEGGYERLSTRGVAARAGVPIGSVYRFFADISSKTRISDLHANDCAPAASMAARACS